MSPQEPAGGQSGEFPQHQLNSINTIIHQTRAAQIISKARISDVYRAVTGTELQRHAAGCWRGRATWRDGDGWNVALDDGKGAWHDFASRDGGGIIALVERALRCRKSDALRWLADFTGVPLEDSPVTPNDRRHFAQERAALGRDLQAARYWRRSAEQLCELVLIAEKSRLESPGLGAPNFDQLREAGNLLRTLNKAGDASLVAEYQEWVKSAPAMTAAMVWAAQRQEQRHRAALQRFLDDTGDPNARH